MILFFPKQNDIVFIEKVSKDKNTMVYAILQEFNEKFVVPAWPVLAKHCTEIGDANMKVVYEYIYIAEPSSSQPMAKKKGSSDDTHFHQIGIPVFVNTKKLEQHEELKYHNPAHSIKEASKRPLEIGSCSSKEKTHRSV